MTTLRTFVDVLDERGLLQRVRRSVDTVYEISTVARALRGRPVLFENVTGFSMPVVSNVCASRDLLAMALGVEKAALLAKVGEAIEHPVEPPVESAHAYHELAPDATKLPILTHYPQDGGPFVASGIVIARDAEYGINASFHRAMVCRADLLALRIVDRHFSAFIRRGLREFAFCIGNPLPVLLAAAVSVEIGKSELAIAHALAPSPVVEVAGHLVPPAEIVMICTLTGELHDEGPFLDLTETFDIVRQQPVARIDRVFARPGALYHALLPGDLEHKVLMGTPREPTIFREVAKECTCLDVRITPGGCSWLHGAVKIRKAHADDGRRAIRAAFRGHASMKHVFIVDEDIDIDDPLALEWAMATRFQAHRDLIVLPGEKGSSLDPSAEHPANSTTKVGFDLTIPWDRPREYFLRAQPPMPVNLADYV
ncbi:MAG: UbiD family decarboxylase [Candidatus Schekmanbacteria bacterium]|nr:UbiD family decarboxylase [Candidatus Schekmanbacteria bacterium]